MWLARMPIEPTDVRVETISTSSLNASPSGVSTSTWNGVRAMAYLSSFFSSSSSSDVVLVARRRSARLVVGVVLRLSTRSLVVGVVLGLAPGLVLASVVVGLLVLLVVVLLALAAARGRHDVVDRALEQEHALGEVVVLAVEDLAERAHRLADRHVDAGRAGELLGDVERLRQEALDLARALHEHAVLVGELVDAEDGDDVLQLAVALQHLLDLVGDVEVLLADDLGLEDRRGRVQRVDRRVDALLGDRPRQRRGRVEVGEHRGRRRVGEVVRRHVDRLDRGDRALAGRRDPLLQLAHLGLERRLVAHLGGHAAEQRGDLGAGLDEAEDVVDEEEHVLPLLVAEVLRHRQARRARRACGRRAARSSGRTRASSCR